jgi:hypothetical protein
MTEGFDAAWLALREPHDVRARSAELADAFLAALPPRPRILDLGAGTGSNARYIDAHAIATGRTVDWLLVDGDGGLLSRATGIRAFQARTVDFAAPERIDLAGVDGVTASALFDLVSEAWFTRFAALLAGRPLLAALTADGSHRWDPADPDDGEVERWFAEDMCCDKGFGPAMGLAAPAGMAATLGAAGYELRDAATPWTLGPDDAALRAAMLDGVAEAAARHGDGDRVARWRERRQGARALRLTVGHRDILALPRR